LFTRAWLGACWDVPHAVVQPGTVCANAGQDAKATTIASLAARSRGKPLCARLLPNMRIANMRASPINTAL
jgi:hypothetical protein